ncbi:MAG: B12-binding domain-containing radical SAM protein [Candidatus Sericytochromatia bacterium]
MDLSRDRQPFGSRLPVPIYAVHPIHQWAPLALGLMGAWLQDQRPEHCQIITPFAPDTASLLAQIDKHGPGLILFSNYMWTREANLAISAAAKAHSPNSVIVHGGPDTPAYTSACAAYLQRYPFVDLAIHGAGEDTLLALFDALLQGSPLSEVNGLGYLEAGTLIKTPARPRLQDPNRYPSPYLTGLFESLPWQQWSAITLETNRGCPYGCTFCDWGSATQQKIQRFDMARITAEVAWLAQHRIPKLWIADSNFGIFERDLEITRMICATKEKYGYPHLVITNYAKNTKQHLVEIIEMLVDHGLVGTGIVSLQTRDQATLKAVRRSNIKTEEYDRLRTTFEARKLPMSTQLMIGLPGSTRASFKDDLRFFFNQNIDVQIFRTVVLPNSPMAAPEYIAEHGLVFEESGMLRSTQLLSEAELNHIEQLGRLFRCAHTYGMLRYWLCFLQWDYDLDPIEVLDRLTESAQIHSDPWIQRLWDAESPPYDLLTTHPQLRERLRSEGEGPAFYAALKAWTLATYPQVQDDAALQIVCEVQEAVMPNSHTHYPLRLKLRHDFVRYYTTRREHGDSQQRLADTEPGLLTVSDPLHVSEENLLTHLQRRQRPVVIWELLSALSPEGTEAALFAAQVLAEQSKAEPAQPKPAA